MTLEEILKQANSLNVGCPVCYASFGHRCWGSEMRTSVHRKRQAAPHEDRKVKACEVALWAYQYGKYYPGKHSVD